MTIYELKGMMESFHQNDFPTASLELVNRISNFSELKELLNSVVGDPVELGRIAENSFVHNLGFIRINLIGWETSKCMIKLHIWNLYNGSISKGQDNGAASIHNHLYDFRSAILLGKMFFKIFTESQAGTLYNKYENPLSDDKYIFNYKGNCFLQELTDVSIVKSSNYFIKHDTIHITSAADECTATICIQSEVKKDVTYLYTKGHLNDLPKAKRFDSAMLKNTINSFLKCCDYDER